MNSYRTNLVIRSVKILFIIFLITMMFACSENEFKVGFELQQQQIDHQQMTSLANSLLSQVKGVAQGKSSQVEFASEKKRYEEISKRLLTNITQCQSNGEISSYYGLLAQVSRPSKDMLDSLDNYFINTDEIIKIRKSLSEVDAQLESFINTIRRNVGELAGSAKKIEVARTLNALSEYMYLSGGLRLKIQYLLQVDLFHQDSVSLLFRHAYSIRRKLDSILEGNTRFNIPPIKGTNVRVILELLRVQYKKIKIKQVDDLYIAQATLNKGSKDHNIVFLPLTESIAKSGEALNALLVQVSENGIDSAQCLEQHYVSNWMKKVASWITN